MTNSTATFKLWEFMDRMHNPAGPETRRHIVQDYLVKYSLRFCTPVFIGVLTKQRQNLIASGTATLLQIGDCKMIVTDDHVLREYDDKHRQDAHVSFQVGAAPFDPAERLIDRNARKDLCTFDATELELNDREGDKNMPPIQFYQADLSAWPLRFAEIARPVIFGGFPAALRKQSGVEVVSSSFSLAATPVTGVQPDYFTCNMDRSGWTTELGSDHPNVQLREWGGLSGGPVLYDGDDTLRPELVGFIMEYQPDIDQLKASHAALVRADGKIEPGTLM